MGFGFRDEHGFEFTVGCRITALEGKETSASEWCIGVSSVVRVDIVAETSRIGVAGRAVSNAMIWEQRGLLGERIYVCTQNYVHILFIGDGFVYKICVSMLRFIFLFLYSKVELCRYGYLELRDVL